MAKAAWASAALAWVGALAAVWVEPTTQSFTLAGHIGVTAGILAGTAFLLALMTDL